jgi:hypothetical protein
VVGVQQSESLLWTGDQTPTDVLNPLVTVNTAQSDRTPVNGQLVSLSAIFVRTSCFAPSFQAIGLRLSSYDPIQ